MALTRWGFDDRFRWPDEVFRAFAPLFQAASAPSAGVFPAVNIHDDGEAFLVRAEIPGVSKEAIEISVKGAELTLRGEREIPTAEGASFHRRECAGGKFSRVVTLPQPVAADQVKATFQNGVLEVVLPRVPEAKPRTITVH